MELKTVLEKGSNCARYGARIDQAGIYRWYVSDLDAAFFIQGGKRMPNFSPRSGVGADINTFYGKDIIMHGDHMSGLIDKIKGVSPDYLFDEVYVFSGGGFIEAGPMHAMFDKYMSLWK